MFCLVINVAITHLHWLLNLSIYSVLSVNQCRIYTFTLVVKVKYLRCFVSKLTLIYAYSLVFKFTRLLQLCIYVSLVKVLTNMISAGVVDAQQLGLGRIPARGNCHRHREEEENLKYHDRQVKIILSLSFGSVQKRLRAVAFVWMNIMACIGIELRPSKRLKCPSRF